MWHLQYQIVQKGKGVAFFIIQLAETKAYKKQNIRLTDHNKLDFLNQKRLLNIIQKKDLK